MTKQWKWKKTGEHRLTEYDITYQWKGSKKTRHVEFKDGKPYMYDGFISLEEKQFIQEITEGEGL